MQIDQMRASACGAAGKMTIWPASIDTPMPLVLALIFMMTVLVNAPSSLRAGDLGGNLLAYTAQVDRLNREKREKN